VLQGQPAPDPLPLPTSHSSGESVGGAGAAPARWSIELSSAVTALESSLLQRAGAAPAPPTDPPLEWLVGSGSGSGAGWPYST